MFRHYLVVSAASLAADWLCLIALTLLAQVAPGKAALAAYLVGGVFSYALSRRFVFQSTITGRGQICEISLFGVSCILGALLTGGIVHVATPVSGQFTAKAIAVTISFATVYWLRRVVVFNWRGLTGGEADLQQG